MNKNDSPILKEVVLIGGGHSHVHIIKMFGMEPVPGVRVTLISRDFETPYSGMLPGYVSGFYTKEECHIDLVRLCAFSSTRLIHSEANGIDTNKKLIYFKNNRPPIRYDILAIDIGITPKPIMPDAAVNPSLNSITAVKPIDSFANRWEEILSQILISDFETKYNIVVVGGGAGGVELIFAIHYRIQLELLKRGKDPKAVDITLVTKGDRLMNGHSKTAADAIFKLMQLKSINVLFNTNIINATTSISTNYPKKSISTLVSNDNQIIPYDQVFWCIDATTSPWLQNTGLDLTSDGFIKVHSTLESVNIPDVFATGDCCHIIEHPRPKAGVFAVRAGPPLLNNMKRKLFNLPLEKWTPQTEFLGKSF